MGNRKEKARRDSGISSAIKTRETPPVDRVDAETLQEDGTQLVDSGQGMHGELILNADMNKTPMRGGVTDSEIMHGHEEK